MTSRDGALLGLRLLAIYLFVDAGFWTISVIVLGRHWWFEEPMLFEEPSIARIGASMALGECVQALLAGYVLWYSAPQAAEPICCREELQSLSKRVSPWLTLSLAVWGATHLVPAMGELVRTCHIVYWMRQHEVPLLQEVGAGRFFAEVMTVYVVALLLTTTPRSFAGLLFAGMPTDGGRSNSTASAASA